MSRATAAIVAVSPSQESIYYVTVTLRVQHTGWWRLRRPRYRLRWPGGDHHGRIARSIRRGAPVELSVRITRDAGDLRALLDDPAAATVEIA